MNILCYHAVQPGWTAPMSIEPDLFERHVDWLVRHRRVVPLHEVLATCARSGRLPRRATALTFDDGFASVHEHALPVLARHRVPSTVFLVARTFVDDAPVDWVDRPPPARLRTLDREQVRELQASGVRFESHSWRHADLTTLSYDACVEDLRSSRELLESELGHPVRVLAYPRGRHDADVRRAARRAGYDYALTLPEQREQRGAFAVPRVGVHYGNSTAQLRLKTTRPYVALRTNPLLIRAVATVRG